MSQQVLWIAKQVVRFYSLFKMFAENFKKTVIIVTHNSNIAKVADKVIRLKNGKILEISLNDSPADIKEVEW